MKEANQVDGLGVDQSKILKLILEKQDVIVLTWSRTESSGVLLWTQTIMDFRVKTKGREFLASFIKKVFIPWRVS
jgi:hypothetical protein